ncbi:sulfite exporter TauE/SafE family protein [Patescibacteria group bacterium]|nr:sulfite exporter TauE/SafE family protein [Patescibacteria group bacterium]MBU4162309.1 sulfite exporter TauE/SafE family protein [Patescibacteria group bacterium]
MSENIKEHTYHIKGMHCASCEILIEKRLLELENIKSIEASAAKSRALIEHEGERPSPARLNEIFRTEGYIFSDQPEKEMSRFKPREFFITLFWGLLIVAVFIGLNRFGLSGLINVSSKSSLLVFLVFGFMAGISSCAALVGGIILSMSKQWGELYSNTDSWWKKIQPHLIFNAGRIISYSVLGAVLGAIGSRLNFSLSFGSILVMAVSIIMIFLALQMFGFKAFRKFQFTMPKFITRFIADESHFKGRYMPFLMGAFTFFLPCGFTITAQGLALISSSAIQGGLIMLLFAIGTLPMLLMIGLSSVKFSQKPHLSHRFLKIAGILVLFFALYNINSQLNVLGMPSFSDLGANSNQPRAVVKDNGPQKQDGLAPIVDGKQILKMDASSRGYSPSYFKVRAGMPARWEITDKGTSGCTNAIISKNLFDGEIPLTPGQTSIKEFIPGKPGKYKFSCWMGMVSGIIEVIDDGNVVPEYNSLNSNGDSFNPSGAEGSGGSCGSSGACSCGGE